MNLAQFQGALVLLPKIFRHARNVCLHTRAWIFLISNLLWYCSKPAPYSCPVLLNTNPHSVYLERRLNVATGLSLIWPSLPVSSSVRYVPSTVKIWTICTILGEKIQIFQTYNPCTRKCLSPLWSLNIHLSDDIILSGVLDQYPE